MDIGFFGTPALAASVLGDLVSDSGIRVAFAVTNPDAPVGRSGLLRPTPVKETALAAGIPVFAPERVRGNDEFLRQIGAFPVDYFVVVAYGKILPREILSMPGRLCVNVHGSLLPKYRGASPIQSALLEGETETGVTVMAMSEGMDEGDMLDVLPIPIERSDTSASLFRKFSSVSGNFLIQTLRKHASGLVHPVPQDASLATYCRKITKEDARFQPDVPAEILFNRYRAYFPWPWLHAFFEGKKLSIEECEVLPEDECPKIRIGEVFLSNLGFPVIRTPEGGLILRVVKLEWKKSVSGADFVRGYPRFSGCILS